MKTYLKLVARSNKKRNVVESQRHHHHHTQKKYMFIYKNERELHTRTHAHKVTHNIHQTDHTPYLLFSSLFFSCPLLSSLLLSSPLLSSPLLSSPLLSSPLLSSPLLSSPLLSSPLLSSPLLSSLSLVLSLSVFRVVAVSLALSQESNSSSLLPVTAMVTNTLPLKADRSETRKTRRQRRSDIYSESSRTQPKLESLD